MSSSIQFRMNSEARTIKGWIPGEAQVVLSDFQLLTSIVNPEIVGGWQDSQQ